MNAIMQLASVQRVDLDARRKGIGGSDIAAVLGVSPYKSAYTAGLVLFYWVN